MANWLSARERARTAGAEGVGLRCPIPTRIVSNGEFNPLPQTSAQRRVETRLRERVAYLAPRTGQSRRDFLRSSCGMAAAFLAMNEVFGPLFDVTEAEAAEPELGARRRAGLAGQFVFDSQVHFVRDDFREDGLLDLGRFAARHWNPEMLRDHGLSLERYKFENFLKEVYLDSETDVALLSGAPSDAPGWRLLENEQMARARRVINEVAGSRRLLCHAVFTPRRKGWLDDVDRAIEEQRPDAWKGYTIGDPLNPSKFAWRLDDEKLIYPFYEKIARSGITTVCVHKGLLPRDYEKSFAGVWQYATVDDLPKAARDWPQLTFVIYHAGLRPFLELPDHALAEFERTGRVPWASDLARIPAEHQVENVYAEIGTSFANSAVASPRFCAAFLGTLLRDMGSERVLWGTDSVWYGAPQWQIEALRRLEIPADLKAKHGFPSLGGPDGELKNKLFGLNAARLYGLEPKAARAQLDADGIAAIKRRYEAEGRRPSNAAYGFVAVGPGTGQGRRPR